jgi:hypothetical protein
MSLTLAEANRIVEGAVAKANELNIKISVAVCDAGGRLMAFNRMDGAILGSVYGCQGKAVASAAFARPSGELAERADTPIIQSGSGADHTQWYPRRRVWRGWRHGSARRRLRPRRGHQALNPAEALTWRRPIFWPSTTPATRLTVCMTVQHQLTRCGRRRSVNAFPSPEHHKEAVQAAIHSSAGTLCTRVGH